MSTYPFWSLSFRVRPDVEPATVRVLEAMASDRAPATDDVASLHPVVRHYVADWRRLLGDEQGPFVGSPVRLSWTRRAQPQLQLSIELSLHDDELANGGWILWTWLLRLVDRPEHPGIREVIGCHGLYRNDADTQLVVVDRDGILDGRVRITFDELEATWRDPATTDGWDDWRG